jgi:hypothetical protein
VDNQFEPLATGEVLSVDESSQILIGHRTFRVGELSEAIRVQLEGYVSGWNSEKDAWFSEAGIPCEVLRFTANGWQKGKVRINLEFCPQEAEDEQKAASAKVDDKLAFTTPPATEDELDLIDSPLNSASFDDELSFVAPPATENELELVNAPIIMDDEPELANAPLSMDDELELVNAPLSVDDELELVNAPLSMDDELQLETPAAIDFGLEFEAPTTIYAEMEQEILIVTDDNFDTLETPTSLDDELGEISQNIEQELELEEAPMPTEEELLDLGAISDNSNDDLDFGEMSGIGDDEFQFDELSANGQDDLDFGEMSMGDEEFQFGEISSNGESEENENNSLLDDVWQDMNEASWQNKKS